MTYMEKQGTRAHVAILVNRILEGTSKACRLACRRTRGCLLLKLCQALLV